MRWKKFFIGVVGIFWFSLLLVAQNYQSIHQEQLEYYKNLGITDALQAEAVFKPTPMPKNKSNCQVNKIVYGWHPYWVGSVYQNYQWNLLSDLCFFSYEVDPNTGNPISTHGWSTAAVVDTALAKGVRVHLCVTLFSNHATFFSSTTAQQTLINNLINLIQARNAHGVNIDFEGVPSSQKSNLTNFMINLCNQMHAAIPGSMVSMATYAVDWGGVFDLPVLNNYVDLFIIMGYDYYWSGSSNAGPNDPLYTFVSSYNYNLAKSVNYYLSNGVSKTKLALGLPYYGREWPTSSNQLNATTTGSGVARTYQYVKNNPATYNNKQWHNPSHSEYYVRQSGGQWYQCFISEEFALRKRLDVVNQYGIAGIGIWALGYDDGYTQYWDALKDKMSSCAVHPCSDSLFDMGGPAWNYLPNQNYTFTIAPDNAYQVQLTFQSFSTEQGYDSLFVYDGNSTSSPLIGAYSGNVNPGTLTSSGPALTLRFKSDGATQSSGYKAVYQCMQDNVPPTTAISTSQYPWVTADFVANFSDNDNVNVEKAFYQVIDNNNGDWRANATHGFFSDNFDGTTIHPDWTVTTGTWSINNNYLEQSDESLGNTNIYASLNQMLSNRYLYHWEFKIEGSGSNRRAGFHYFCDSAHYTNRRNSYFVWFRLDQGKVQLYKVTNDIFSLVNEAPYAFTAGQWYDAKVIFDRIMGKHWVYLNNQLITVWNDPSPHTAGNYISFRSGNSKYTVNNLKVYRSRYASVTVSVGPGNAYDIRYQSPDPATIAAKVKSIVMDNAANLSSIAVKDLYVDWSPPVCSLVLDGALQDEDTTYVSSQLQFNWMPATDPNSGIASYLVAIGTAPGYADILPWTSAGNVTNYTQTGLSLQTGTIYYTSIKPINGAGLYADSCVSDGILYLAPSSLSHLFYPSITFFPNPVEDDLYVFIPQGKTADIILMDMAGRVLLKQKIHCPGQSLSLKKGYDLPSGIYVAVLSINDEIVKTEKIVLQ